MRCQGRANPPFWIIAKHKIQSTVLPPRISLLLKDFLPMKTRLFSDQAALSPTFTVQWFLIITRWRDGWHFECSLTVRNESVAVISMPASEQWLCQLLQLNASWDTSRRPMPVQLPCWLWRRETREKRETDFQGAWLGCLTNVGGLPWAVTKCSYHPLISGLMENRNNSCSHALKW